MRTVVVFDFDGTLTRRDTLFQFLRYLSGPWGLAWGLLLCSPWIVLMKLGLYDNGRCKERLLQHFLCGLPMRQLWEEGYAFARFRRQVLSDLVTGKLLNHTNHGHTVYVITASLVEWVAPLCQDLPVKAVLGTEWGGRGFACPNCYGPEKVRRLLQAEPHRDEYRLVVYGDSKGDRDLFNIADEYHIVDQNQLQIHNIYPDLARNGKNE